MSLIFPRTILDQHLVMLGKTGAGKSSALRHIVEYLLSHKKRVCIIDPKGDWYGLKADGTGPGFSIILFGDFKDHIKSDVPLIPKGQLDDDQIDVAPAAKHVAELVTSGNRPCVIGMRGWTQGSMTKFWIEFARTVFNQANGELYLVIDEVHNFAPKGKTLSVESNKGLHWCNRLINEGRGLGVTMLIASQRPQKVHNDTLTACETLVAMRVVHAADRGAIEDWLKGAGDKPIVENILKSLAGLKRGEAWVWSPEVGFGPDVIQFPMFTTFDSFAPAKSQQKLEQKGWASVNLDEVREKLSTVIEKAKADDPEELKKKIRTLEADIRTINAGLVPRQADAKEIERLRSEVAQVRASVKTKVEKKTIEKRTVVNSAIQSLTNIVEKVEEKAPLLIKELRDVIAEANEINRQALQIESTTQLPALPVGPKDTVAVAQLPFRKDSVASRIAKGPPPDGPVSFQISRLKSATGAHSFSSNGNQELSAMMRKMLISLAQHPDGLSKAQILLHISYRSSGKVSSTFAELGRNGWVQPGGPGLQITEAGLKVLGDYEPLPTGSALCLYLLTGDKLFQVEKALLRPIVDAYPHPISKGQILEQAGYKSSGKISSTFARLVRYGYAIKSGSSLLTASSELFD